MKEIFVAAGIIEKDNKILCMQRDKGKHEYVSLKWEFPGGKIERGETAKDALIRELHEEMDMDVEVVEHFMDIRHEYPDLIVNMSCFLCKTNASEFKLNVHKDFRWLDADELYTLDWAGADWTVVDKLVAKDKKCILLTGAFGGMGSATAKMLVDRGYLVLALDRVVSGRSRNIIPIECDVTSDGNINSAFERVRLITDKLHAIIHYAGMYVLDSFVEIDTEKLDKIFDVNLRGAMVINKVFFPLMDRGSRIIMTTSELAPLNPLPFTGIYAVTKSALDKYAHSIRMELQLLDISVSVLRAGAVNTEMLGVSTSQLSGFCGKTKLYKCNADKFRNIVDSVEARSISTEKLAGKMVNILECKKPKMVYSINRNPLLRLLNILPKSWQFAIIKKILK